MEAIRIIVTGNQAHSIGFPVLTSGTVGQPVEFIFDEAWEGLTKTAVFRVGGLTKDVVGFGTECTVPWEVMEKPGCTLQIGVYGTNTNGTLVIPTAWVKLGSILPGADPSGDESTEPTLPVWEQIRKAAVKTVNGVAPDENGNVQVETGGNSIELDATLTKSGKAADAAAVGTAISANFNDEAKNLLLQILRNGIYSSDQSENISALENALNAVDEYEYRLVYEVSESEILVGKSMSYERPPYTLDNDLRSSYVGDRILVEYGYIYKFIFETRTTGKNVSDFSLGVQTHNNGALQLFKSGKRFCFANSGKDLGTYDEGWQTNGYELICPETIIDEELNTNSSVNPGFVHFTFKRNDGSALIAGDISRVLIYRKKVQA